MIKIVINGLGRIGKSIARLALGDKSFKIVAINELNNNIQNIAYVLNYDTTYGSIEQKFKVISKNKISNGSQGIFVFSKNITEIDFLGLEVDFVIDASGDKRCIEFAQNLTIGSKIKAFFLTHPNSQADINVVIGSNENSLKIKDKIISTSSCNATALMPILEIVDFNFGIECGEVATIHPFLGHQKVLDSGCIGSFDRKVECNFEFGRSASSNIIPSKTTTVDACEFVNAKFNSHILASNSFRVPTQTVGAINATFVLKNSCEKSRLLEIFQEFEQKQSHKILMNNFDPLVSMDFKGQEFTSIIDHRFTDVKCGKLLNLVIWYDNEWGYASKVLAISKLYSKLFRA